LASKISVIIPACDAQATLARAIDSLRAQTDPDWQAIVVSDDLFDYRGLLVGVMGDEPRLRFASTGLVRSGCHNARNVGFPLIEGDFVTQLDADDEFAPSRFSDLRPLAESAGAAADNLAVVDDGSGVLLASPLPAFSGEIRLDLAAFMKLNAPLVPLIQRRYAKPRAIGVELSEDVVANIQLIDQIGALPVVGRASYIYRVRTGSIAHSSDSAGRFEAAYSAYIERLQNGDGFGVSALSRQIALDGLTAKRSLNRAFEAASRADSGLTFQAFVSALGNPALP
jgi:succinoglycan biosynthesis protein ExoO